MNEALHAAAASLLIIGFPGTTSSEEVRSLLRRGVGGIILFKRNIEDPVQVAALINKLQASRKDLAPLLMSVDQEGGRVARLGQPFTQFPPMRLVGNADDEYLAERVGAVLALELRALGFNLDYTPVMDVDSNPANPVIGDRSFSSDPFRVARMGVALLCGMQNNGVLACAKHFPGHGDTIADSHLELPELPHDMNRLHNVELVPFKAAIDAGVATIMTAHVRFNALDPEVPATLSPTVIDGLLRRQLNYPGVIISDDLEMKAVLDHYGVAESARRGLAAGVDAFLVCSQTALAEEALEALVKAGEASSAMRDRIFESASRMASLRERVGIYEPVDAESVLERLGRPEHLEVAEEIRHRARLT